MEPGAAGPAVRRRPVIHPRMAERLAQVVAGSGVEASDTGTLPDRADILRGPVSIGPGGEVLNTPPVAASNRPCRLERDNIGQGQERLGGDQIEAISFWIVTFPPGEDVQADDQIRITTKDDRIFEVKSLGDPQSYSAETFVRCVEIGRRGA